MLIEKIPALYGRALLEAADDAGVLDEVAEEVSFFGNLLAGLVLLCTESSTS